MTNTIANPRAVMIHSYNTSITLSTVMRSWRFHTIANKALLQKSFL